ncbi:hypothetical protein BTVI_134311 [Pitangus sulphuratus]|nr:hypothetical protein BTVI_134311 [Pitangus sulphuratus]
MPSSSEWLPEPELELLGRLCVIAVNGGKEYAHYHLENQSTKIIGVSFCDEKQQEFLTLYGYEKTVKSESVHTYIGQTYHISQIQGTMKYGSATYTVSTAVSHQAAALTKPSVTSNKGLPACLAEVILATSPEPDSLSTKHEQMISSFCPSSRGLTVEDVVKATEKMAQHMAKDLKGKNAKRLKGGHAER